MKSVVLTLFFLCNVLFCLSQQPSYFFMGDKQFEGVQIYDVIQDKKLNYWFATDQGFYKYNHYYFEKVDCANMKGQSAFGFVLNKDGVIFCYNLNNQIIKIENDSCSVFYELKEKEKASDIYLTITSSNQLLVLTRTALLFESNGKAIRVQHPSDNYYAFPFQTIRGSIISHINEKDSLLVFDKNVFTRKSLGHGFGKINGILKFFRIDGKVYAISTGDKQLFAFNEQTYTLHGLPENSLFQNKEFLRFYNENNQLWIAGTVSGIQLLDKINEKQLPGRMFSEYLVSDVYKDNEGNLLLSTFNHGVIVIPNLEIPDVLNLPKEQPIVSIQHDKDLGMLMGTLHGQLLAFKNNDYKILSDEGNRPLQSVFSWPDFKYIIYDDGKVKAYNKLSGKITVLFEGSLKDAALLNHKSILLASNIGVCKITIESNDVFSKTPLNEVKIRSSAIDVESGSGIIYVATSNGMKVISSDGNLEDIVKNKESVFANDITKDEKSIYISTKAKQILELKNGKVIREITPWLNEQAIEITKLILHDDKFYTLSSFGFIVFDLKGNAIAQLNKVHGFATNKIFDFEIAGDEIWINHSKGVQKLMVKQLQNKIEKPLISFAKIIVNDNEVFDSSNTVFDSEQRKFKFIISSPTLRNKENIRYHYQLKGYEEQWQVADYNANEIVYNALAPGNYQFIIKVENQGVFTEPISYAFTIAFPFYARWWFVTICIIIFLGIVLAVYRWQLNIQRKKSQQINELNASKLTAIQSQMNPHFIFNSLNSIQDLVLKGDVENSYSYITTFSNLVRRTLNYSEKDFIDFDQEIKLLELYLSLEKLRFKKDFNYIIDSDGVEDIMIPPLLIQPFVENALIHGLLHKEGQKRIKVTFTLKENLICIVEDNGVGREKAKAIKLRQRSEHESFSGKAIHKRFEILSNVFEGDFGYTYEDLYQNNEPTGTKVILSIPVKHKF